MKSVAITVVVVLALAIVAFAVVVAGATSSFFLKTIGLDLAWGWCSAITALGFVVKGVGEAVKK